MSTQNDNATAIGRANAAAVQLYGSGAHTEALSIVREALKEAELTLGPEHPETLVSVNTLAKLYHVQGRYDEAESLYRRALEVSERILGPEHLETLASIYTLAWLYQDQGRYVEAEALYEQMLEASERILGREHPGTLAILNNLAGLYETQGRYSDAELLYHRALEASERLLGPEHPSTLTGVSNLAFLRQAQGRYGEAEQLYSRTLEASERILGSEHFHTIRIVSNLAHLYDARGRYGDAELLYRRSLEARDRILGPEHPDTLDSVNGLAGLYWTQGRYGEAEPLYLGALEASERVLGPEHPQTLTSVNGLALLYESQGRFGEAEPLFRRALEANERVLGPEHPDTLNSVNNLAFLYQAQGRYGEAEPLYRRALEARERVLGAEHPDTLTVLNNLAANYQAQSRPGEAEPHYLRALRTSERVLGPEHPDTLVRVSNLAALYDALGRHSEAEPLFQRALEASERVLGPAHPNTLTVLNNLAALHHSQGRWGEAEPLYRRALEARERVLGAEHPDTLTTRDNLAGLLVRTDRHVEALRELRAIDLHLGQWLDTEVRTTRAAAMQRQVLRQSSVYQDAAFSLALAHPSDAALSFAGDLVLRWKKRLAQDAAVLNNLARESRNPALLETITEVQRGRAALSNVAFDPDVPAEERVRLREALEASEAELRARSSVFDRFLAVKSARSDEVQLALPQGSALVEYRLFSHVDFNDPNSGVTHLLAVVLAPAAAPALVDLGEAASMIALQRSLTNAKRRKAEGLSFDAQARAGFDRLIAPLLPHLGSATTLFLAPDGPLNALPFAALADADGQRLIERFQLHLLQTGRDLVARDRPVLGKGLVAVGGVDFGPLPKGVAAPAPSAEPDEIETAALAATRSQFGGFSPLPESRAEAINIADAYATYRSDEPAPVVLLEADATERALKSLASPPRVLHLATHGYYLETGSIDGQPLLQSGITLAGANRALEGRTGPDGENGILHAIEAQTLNLYGTELVVLSACDTGQGAVDYSEGLEGLPRALYVAGAKNVLVALWPIGDFAARNFMERFYETWLAQPISDPALALHQTKLAYINSSNPAEREPDAWAPFVLFEG